MNLILENVSLNIVNDNLKKYSRYFFLLFTINPLIVSLLGTYYTTLA